MKKHSAIPARRGALTSVASAIISALSLFAIFRISIEIYTAALIGCWALIQGLFLVARVADTGAGSNVTRVLASKRLEQRLLPLWPLIRAALSITTVPVMLISAALVFPITWYVTSRFGEDIPAEQILQLAILSATYSIFSCSATIVLSIVEGLGRLDLKNYVNIWGNALILIIAYPALSNFGPAGLGIVYSVMSLTQFLAALFVVNKAYRRARDAATDMEKVGYVGIVRALWKENLKLSYIAILRLSFEPVTKLLLSLVADLQSIAAFELAIRVTTQVRTVVQAASQPLLVAGSGHKPSHDRAIVENVFWKYNALIAISTGVLIELQILGAPVLAILGLGSISVNFIIFFAILVVANALNSVGLPGYFLQVSSGKLEPLTRIHLVMAICNLLLGGLGAVTLGAVGVVLGYGVAFSVGGILCLKLLTKNARGSNTLRLLNEFWGLTFLVRVIAWVGVAIVMAYASMTWSSDAILYLVIAAQTLLLLPVLVSRKRRIMTIIGSG
ncbi:hypothetical protein [Rhodococcus sp. 05-2254-6]|uniref:hypothetical protein n=1 Tax=Rhodococcus sp. 05-2254-6 TaxID=2022489 RepID=UPI00117A8C69|nr:hypothetical protein [Rhodococcus sp. 05-2254-6]